MDKSLDSHSVAQLIAQIEAYAEEVQHSMNSIMERLDVLSDKVGEEISNTPSKDPVLHDDHIEEAAVNMSENLGIDPIGMSPTGDTAVTENPVEVPSEVTPSVGTNEPGMVSGGGEAVQSPASVPVQQFDPVGISQESEVQAPSPVAPGTPVFEPPQEVAPQVQSAVGQPEPVSPITPTVPQVEQAPQVVPTQQQPPVAAQAPQVAPAQQASVTSDSQDAVGGGESPVFQV